jgi:hypothetical protein
LEGNEKWREEVEGKGEYMKKWRETKIVFHQIK